MPDVQRVDAEHIERALVQLENVDIAAANALRAQMHAFSLYNDCFELSDMLHKTANQLKLSALRAQELSNDLGDIARGNCD